MHHFRSRMLWKLTNDHFYNCKTEKSFILRHFRSPMLWKSIIHRSAWGNPVEIEVATEVAIEVQLSDGSGLDFRPSGGSGRPPTPSPPHAPTPAHPHTRSCTRIDFNTPRFSSFGKKNHFLFENRSLVDFKKGDEQLWWFLFDFCLVPLSKSINDRFWERNQTEIKQKSP